MKALLILLVMVVIVVVVLGVYQGWFNFSSSDDKGQANFKVSVDKDKIVSDRDTAVDTVHNLGHKAADKIEATTQKVPE